MPVKQNVSSISASDRVIQVISTLAIEDMYVDDYSKRNLILMATHQKSSKEVIAELKQKYARK